MLRAYAAVWVANLLVGNFIIAEALGRAQSYPWIFALVLSSVATALLAFFFSGLKKIQRPVLYGFLLSVLTPLLGLALMAALRGEATSVIMLTFWLTTLLCWSLGITLFWGPVVLWTVIAGPMFLLNSVLFKWLHHRQQHVAVA